MPTAELRQNRNATDLTGYHKVMEQLKQRVEATQQDSYASKASELLRVLYTCPYAERKDRNIPALDGTCQWFVQHSRFLNWKNRSDAGLLWVSADPGCGKSVLSRYLIDKVLCVYQDRTICYFFFKDDFVDQRSCSNAMCAMLRQLLIQRPELQQNDVFLKFAQDGEKFKTSFRDLWNVFLILCAKLTTGAVICIFDALDECERSDRALLIQAISQSYGQIQQLRVKFLITSRPYGEIKDVFYTLISKHPTVHLSGESELEAEQISKEIDIVIKHRIHLLSKLRSLTQKEEAYLVERFTSVPHRTYLWAYLTMDIIETTPGLTKGHLEQVLGKLPQTVYEAYEKILNRSSDTERTRLLLQILIAAQRPMSLQEVSLLLCMQEHHQVEDFADIVEPPTRFKQSVRDLCGLFVIVINDLVYFLHQTAREFLVQNLKESIHDDLRPIQTVRLIEKTSTWATSIGMARSHRVMAERCLWFMFTEGAYRYDKRFYEYCNKFWNVHFAEADQFDVEASQTELALHAFIVWTESYGSLSEDIRRSHKIPYFFRPYRSSPIVFAVFFRILSVVRLILKRELNHQTRARIASSGLWWAARSEDLSIMRLLLSYGANPNTNRYGDLPPAYAHETGGETSLAMAITNNQTKTVRLLVEAGADVNIEMPQRKFPSYTTPLGLASDWSYNSLPGTKLDIIEIIETLLLHGADPTKRCYTTDGGLLDDLVVGTPLQIFQRSTRHKNLSHETVVRVTHLLTRPRTNYG